MLLKAQHIQRLEEAYAPKALLDLAAQDKLFMRKAPHFASTREEYVAKYEDVAHLMKNGDGAWYSGVMPWSLAIRIGTVGVPSHGGLLLVQDRHIRLVDVCEFVGCRNRPFIDSVHKDYGQHWWKGQWYWGPMSLHYRRAKLDLISVEEYMLATVGQPYGHYSIVYEAMWHMPILRELAFLHHYKDLETDWKSKTPYCSMFQAIALQKGGIDPVPGRALQLTTPQDTWQSLLWPIKIALVK